MRKIITSAAFIATLCLSSVGGAGLTSQLGEPSGGKNQPMAEPQGTEQRVMAMAPAGKKTRVEGRIIEQGGDRFMLSDQAGSTWTVKFSASTRIEEKKGNPFRSAKKYSSAELLRGLQVEVEGKGDVTGALFADLIRFTSRELEIAKSLDMRVQPVERRLHVTEDRLGQAEQSTRRLSDQVVELNEVSNMARGGARAAQDTADAAMAGVGRTNQRISALDDYEEVRATTVNFRTGSAVLSAEAKSQLDELAEQAKFRNGYLIEVAGFASSDGDEQFNQMLSQSRAEAVVRYLAHEQLIPLRRITMPFGYGTIRPVADNTTHEGRIRNRRVEVRILVSRGLTSSGTPVEISRPGD
ncbi:MAG: OmpA family protein [Acidobacteria bacterium]|nr:OmpA family protein [Acidobacteriota bacterium]